MREKIMAQAKNEPLAGIEEQAAASIVEQGIGQPQAKRHQHRAPSRATRWV